MADLTLGEILAQAEDVSHARTATARILLRQDLAARHAELEAELTTVAAERGDSIATVAPRLSQRLLDLEGEIEAAKVVFVLRSVGRRKWADLLAQHPPTKQQVQDDKRTTFNPETFPIAAIAASCITPEGVDDEAVKRLEVALSDAQFSQLWSACIDANLGGASDPKSMLAAGLARRTKSLSESIAVVEESPEASS